jgi:hypothetical protein
MAEPLSVLDGWMAVTVANQDAQQRLDPTFTRHGPLGANVTEIRALADRGLLTVQLAQSAGMLFDLFVADHQDYDVDQSSVDFQSSVTDLVAALEQIG